MNRNLKMQEDSRTEFKRELSDKLERSVVAFLNYPGGGEIILGIDDKGKAVGLANADALQLKIVDRICNNIRPQVLGLFEVLLDQIDDKVIIRIIVSCGQQRPYYIRKYGMSDKGSFIRVGSSVQPMTEQLIEELLSKRQRVTLQSMVSPRQNLTFNQLRIYYTKHELELPPQFLESLDLRQSTGEFNWVGYLLADHNGVSVKIAVYAGTDKVDLLETREYGNRCLVTSTLRILDRMDSENRTYTKITSKRRLERERVNTIALREAVINAIVHNDYAKGVPLIEIYSDRVVVTSCGGLVDGLSESDFFKCRSMPRNRELMRVFRDMELTEHIGSGMSRILKAYSPAVFELSPSFTVATFFFEQPLVLPTDIINPSTDIINGKIKPSNDKINPPTDIINPPTDIINPPTDIINPSTDIINPSSEFINGMIKLPNDNIKPPIDFAFRDLIATIDAIKRNPTASKLQLAELTGKSQITISRELKLYQEVGLIRRVGSRKTGYWELL